MDKKKSFANVFISIAFKIILLITALLTRRYLIKFVGNDANGINSLYLSIIGILAVAELGVGSAISFSMYKPITENDTRRVAALYKLFVKVYTIIGLIILIAGICIMPLLPYLAKDYNADFSLYLTFGIMLLSVVINYMFSAKTSLINAYKNNYVTTIINSVGLLVQEILQIVLLIIFKSFELYLICRVISICLQWIWTEIYTRKKYKDIITLDEKLDEETKVEVIKNTKAMFMHKIGGLLVNTVDSIIISAFIGVVLLGKYSNYTAIMTSMMGILSLFFSPLTSIIGHMFANGDINQEKKYYNFFYTVNYILGLIFFIGYYMVIDDVVTICFGKDLLLDKSVSFIITLNYFIQFMRNACLLFRDASGTFYNDRFKPLIEGTFNIILSIILVKAIGITGVIIATIITNIFICHIIEPLVLYRHAFKSSVKEYYLKNYICIFIFTIILFGVSFININMSNIWIDFIVNGFIAIAIAMVPVIAIFIIDKNFKYYVNNVFQTIRKRLLKKKA